MEVLKERRRNDDPPESSVPPFGANNRRIEGAETGAPQLGKVHGLVGKGTSADSTAPEIPVEELRRLARMHAATDRRSTGRRGKIQLFVLAMIVLGGFAAWYYYGEAAVATLISPSVGPASVSSQEPAIPGPPEIMVSGPTASPETVLPQPTGQATGPHALTTQPTQPIAGNTPIEVLLQQLEAVSSELAVVQQALQQLASKQDDMARNIGALQASNDDFKKRLASPGLSGAMVRPRKLPVSAAPPQRLLEPTISSAPVADPPPSSVNRSAQDARWPGVSRPPVAIGNN
jgi:hypothetical protein